jgi:hypothetical protein
MGVLIDNGIGSDYTVATNTTSNGEVQRFVLSVSTTGSDAPVGADATNGLDVDVTRLPSSTVGAQTAVTVGTTATLVIAASATRKSVTIRTSADVFVGYSNAVTIANGFPLYADEVWDDTIFKGGIYLIAEAGTVNVRVLEAQ